MSRSADKQHIISSTHVPSDWGDHYGQRVRAWLVPPITGSYVFRISGDDQSELWLGEDSDESSASLIARVDDHVSAGDFHSQQQQRSSAIRLRAGVPYYFEIKHREGTGSDHCGSDGSCLMGARRM